MCDRCDVVSIGVERAIGYDMCRLPSYFNWCSVISIGAVCVIGVECVDCSAVALFGGVCAISAMCRTRAVWAMSRLKSSGN